MVENQKNHLQYFVYDTTDFIHKSAIRHIEEIQQKGKKVDYEIIKMEA